MSRKTLAFAVVVLLAAAACSRAMPDEHAGAQGSRSLSPPTRAQVEAAWLDGTGRKVVVTGHQRVDRSHAAAGTTFDLRKWSFNGPSGWPLTFGEDWSPVSRVVTVGGRVSSTMPDKSWNYLYYVKDSNGAGLRVVVRDWTASYGLTATNVWDGYGPVVREGGEQDNKARFLLEGSYLKGIHDDAVENDDLLSGTVRDCLFDGVFVGFSEQPPDYVSYSNRGSVLKVHRVIARFAPSVQDGKLGSGMVFKWIDYQAGTVDVRHSIFFVEKNSNQNLAGQRFPRGTYKDVTLILGPDFKGPWPVRLPPGVRVTRDVSVYTKARDAWLARHGYSPGG